MVLMSIWELARIRVQLLPRGRGRKLLLQTEKSENARSASHQHNFKACCHRRKQNDDMGLQRFGGEQSSQLMRCAVTIVPPAPNVLLELVILLQYYITILLYYYLTILLCYYTVILPYCYITNYMG